MLVSVLVTSCLHPALTLELLPALPVMTLPVTTLPVITSGPPPVSLWPPPEKKFDKFF